MRSIVGFAQVAAWWWLVATTTIILSKTVRAIDVREESGSFCTTAAAAGSDHEKAGVENSCVSTRTTTTAAVVPSAVVHEIGLDNFESVISSSPWTFVLFYDRLDEKTQDINKNLIIKRLAKRFASRALPKLSFATLDVRQHSYYRALFMEYEGDEGHFVHKFYTGIMNSSTFMGMPDESLYWPFQWTLFGSDFNVYGIMPLDPKNTIVVSSSEKKYADAMVKRAEAWLMPLAGKFRPEVLKYSKANAERHFDKKKNSDNTFTFSDFMEKYEGQYDHLANMCVDEDGDCADWAALGKCDATDYSEWMNLHCRKSCGLCNDSDDDGGDVLSDDGEPVMEHHYTTGAEEEKQGNGFYRYKNLLPWSLADERTTGLMDQLKMLIIRYLTWCISYEDFWDEERKQREDRQTNYGFYLNRMNAQVKELIGNSTVEGLNQYFQEMVFGYGRSHSSLKKYLEEELNKIGPDVKTINDVDMTQFALVTRMREIMKIREKSIKDKGRYKEYFQNMVTKWNNILSDFQENLSRYYVNYRNDHKIKMDDFALQRMDVLDMSDPKDFDVLSSYDEFEQRHTAKRRPVVLANVDMMDHNYTLDYLVERCGNVDVTNSVQISVPVGGHVGNNEWGGLKKYALDNSLMNEKRKENGYDQSLTLEQFVILSEAFGNLYLHDFSLMGACDRLFHESSLYEERQYFRLPSVIGRYDLSQKLTLSSYQLAWPSLFIGRKHSNSKVHVDSAASGFAMYLVSGRKRWVVFDAAERPFLYERIFNSSFIPDVLGLNKNEEANQYFDERFPLLRRAAESGAYEVIQEPGQLVYIPPNTPHAVENLEDSVGVSLNFVPRYGVPHHIHNLIHNKDFPQLELTLKYMMLEGGYDELLESKDPLYTTLAEYKAQL